jgi:8-oxo-dGTP diphosphatase
MTRVAAAVIRKDGRILIARRKEGQAHEGLWEFPGGKIEENETPQECLVREIEEELGLTVRAGPVVAQSEDHSGHGSFVILAVQAEILGGKEVLTVHDRTAWVLPADLKRYRLAPADRELAERIASLEGEK